VLFAAAFVLLNDEKRVSLPQNVHAMKRFQLLFLLAIASFLGCSRSRRNA
jgi:hypothetical protein